LTPKTVENTRLALNAHTVALWGEKAADEVTTEEIRSLVKLGLEGRSEGQRKNVLKFIRSVFDFGVESGQLRRNPCPDLKFQTGEKIKTVLNEEQLKILLSKAKSLDHPWYPIWALASYTGMRNGELYALTWDKVDIERRLIKVDCSWNNKDGFKSTKSGDDRMVEIAPPLVPLLAELKLKSNDTIYVLPRLTKWDKGEQARELRNFLALLGLPRIRFHDLRASWATAMLNRGIEPAKVMLMGGWKEMKTMMLYMRKAGISIKGITDGLVFHHSDPKSAEVVPMRSRSE
jgi:integrase